MAAKKFATIAGFTKLTAQQIFDKSARHLLKQNKRSYDHGRAMCLYEGPHGLGCAAAPFLQPSRRAAMDSLQTDAPGGTAWLNLFESGWVPAKNRKLVAELQGVHDDHMPDAWPQELRAFAIRHRLQYGHIKQLRDAR